jgi:DinB family protein
MNSTVTTRAQSALSGTDLSQARLYIGQTRDVLVGATKMLTSAQWEFAPSPERWSIAQIVEHVIAVQERVIGMIRQNLAAAPPPPASQDREIVDGLVINEFPNRLRKFPSPIPPSASKSDKAGTVGRYAENCAALTQMLTDVPGLREHVVDAPPLRAISNGDYSLMDGYQWILAAAAHAERHTKQILEVVADNAFPLS